MNKLFILLILISLNTLAQNFNEPCATMPVYYNHLNNNSQSQNYSQAESMARAWLNNPENVKYTRNKNNTLIKIPVVVHVVYKTPTQNVDDSLILSQMVVLNQCFRKQNSNYNSTRAIFDSLGADIDVEFCLANFDPNGNPTSGIVRKQAPGNAGFDPILNMDKVKKPVFGGDTAWPCNRYLNIWLVDMSILGQTFVLGYATFPGANPALDGVVIQYNYFGKYAKPGFLGATTVHEVGHWMGMRHIWADDDNGGNPQLVYCDSTDFVDDTPNAGPKSTSNCDKTKNTCTLETAYWGAINPPDMVENYMDYCSDDCMTLFTKGQKARMYSFLNTNPNRIAVTTSTAGCNIISSVISRIDFENLVNIYPNPAQNELQLKIRASFENHLTLYIYNGMGQTCYTAQIKDEMSSINTSKLANGVYFIKVSNSNNYALKRIIIQH